MVLLVNHNDGEHKNYYEGNHIGFHRETKDEKNWLTVVIEGKEGSVTVEIPEQENAKLYLMNSRGKTIETRSPNDPR